MRWWSIPALAFLVTIAPAQADTPIVLHLLKNGNVRFAEGPELNLDQFGVELRRMAAMKPIPELTWDADPELHYAKTLPFLTELKKYNFNVGFEVGQTVVSVPDGKPIP
jgi:hypothetical protein